MRPRGEHFDKNEKRRQREKIRSAILRAEVRSHQASNALDLHDRTHDIKWLAEFEKCATRQQLLLAGVPNV